MIIDIVMVLQSYDNVELLAGRRDSKIIQITSIWFPLITIYRSSYIIPQYYVMDNTLRSTSTLLCPPVITSVIYGTYTCHLRIVTRNIYGSDTEDHCSASRSLPVVIL